MISSWSWQASSFNKRGTQSRRKHSTKRKLHSLFQQPIWLNSRLTPSTTTPASGLASIRAIIRSLPSLYLVKISSRIGETRWSRLTCSFSRRRNYMTYWCTDSLRSRNLIWLYSTNVIMQIKVTTIISSWQTFTITSATHRSRGQGYWGWRLRQ